MIEIYDLLGIQVLKTTDTKQIKTLPTGIFLVKAYFTKESSQKKLLKNNI
ncbi:T9SS type A sorting domain-containing protein [Yeosuana marina]|nr:T9SS type A sorting domain-containing protein [Yeosuana marina]